MLQYFRLVKQKMNPSVTYSTLSFSLWPLANISRLSCPYSQSEPNSGSERTKTTGEMIDDGTNNEGKAYQQALVSLLWDFCSNQLHHSSMCSSPSPLTVHPGSFHLALSFPSVTVAMGGWGAGCTWALIAVSAVSMVAKVNNVPGNVSPRW